MVKARSLKHVCYLVEGITPDHEESSMPNTVHWWNEANETQTTWTTELGAATVFQHFADARKFLNYLKEKWPQVVRDNKIEIKLYQRKQIMVARLKRGRKEEDGS